MEHGNWRFGKYKIIRKKFCAKAEIEKFYSYSIVLFYKRKEKSKQLAKSQPN